MTKTYAVQFDIPDGQTVYAGMHQGAAGFAPTLQTAMMFDSPDRALAMLTNAYGSFGEWGRVVEVKSSFSR